MSDTTYRVYPYRWAVLGSFMLVNLMIQALWIDFSPVSAGAASYYGVSKSAIILLGELFMIIYLPMSIPVSWAIDRFGFRKATGLGAILMALFALLRALAGPSFVLALIGTIGLSIAQPFLMNAWTKVAAHWFAEGERATAVGLVTLSTLLGIAVGFQASASRQDDVDRLHAVRLCGRRSSWRLWRISPSRAKSQEPRRSRRLGRKSPHAGRTQELP